MACHSSLETNKAHIVIKSQALQLARSYAMKPKRVYEISLKFQPPNTITTHPHSFKTITRFSFYYPSFSPLPRLIIIFLFKKFVGRSIQD